MAHVTFKGSEVQLTGCVPAVGDVAPAFTLTGADLGDVSLSDFKGKRVVLSIFPSIDTPVCAASVRHFNVDASTMKNAVVLCVSADLPFAQARFCGAEGLQNVKTLSTFRSPEFGSAYGIQIAAEPRLRKGKIRGDTEHNRVFHGRGIDVEMTHRGRAHRRIDARENREHHALALKV
jgi:thiol peroxidase